MRLIFSAIGTLSFSLLLAGCALQTTATSSPEIVPASTIAGNVHGGQQPVINAKVYLLAVNSSSYGGPGIAASNGNASFSLITPGASGTAADTANSSAIGSYVTTNATTGTFSLPSSAYSCTTGYTQANTGGTFTLSGTEQVYLLVLGGQASSTATSANPYSGLMFPLGACNSATNTVAINEVTTVAMAYAFAGFATDATHIGSSGSSLALTGLANAYTHFTNLSSNAGVAVPPTSTLYVPDQLIDTIANIVASCVNTNGTSSTNCSTLFSYTKSGGATGTAPTNTASAIINLAHNPYPTATGRTTLMGLVPGTGAPFADGNATGAPDFTIGLIIRSGGINIKGDSTKAIAVAADGTVWVPNSSTNSVSKVAVNGVATNYAPSGLSAPSSVAITTGGQIWVTDAASFNLTLLNADGTSPGFYNTGSGAAPLDIAIDTAGNVYTLNLSASKINKLTSTGSDISGAGYSTGTLYGPSALALDANGLLWVCASGAKAFGPFDSNGNSASPPSASSAGGITSPQSIAIAPNGNIWISSLSNNSISQFASTTSGTNYTGGGLDNPRGLAIDSQGQVWVANSGNNNGISEFSSTGTAMSETTSYNGYFYFSSPTSLAIDGSGDVWVANSGDGVTELIGNAAPVVTPIVANFSSPYGSSAVNRP
jgi:streptogramin lyase